MSEKRTLVGKFVKTTWTNLNVRCANGKYRVASSKNKCYDNVLLLFTRDQFKSWCWRQQDLIEALTRPSLDRIDSEKHYTLDNIQIVELLYNVTKDSLTFTADSGRCFSCKEIKPLDAFVRDSRRVITGKTNICKPCESERGCLKYRRLHG